VGEELLKSIPFWDERFYRNDIPQFGNLPSGWLGDARDAEHLALGLRGFPERETSVTTL